MVEMLFNNYDALFQHGKMPIHAASIVQDWLFGHEDQPLQLPDLNNIQLLGSILEKNV